MDWKKGLIIIFIVLIPILFLLLSYQTNIHLINYTPEQKEVISFLQEEKELTAEMTELEFSHLLDVKKVMDLTGYVFYFLLLAVVLISVLNYRAKKRFDMPLLYGGVAALGLVILISLLAVISFDFTFSLFHQIFFSQGNWLFSADSFLIQTFPAAFFISMTKKILFTASIFAIIFIVAGILLRKRG